MEVLTSREVDSINKHYKSIIISSHGAHGSEAPLARALAVALRPLSQLTWQVWWPGGRTSPGIASWGCAEFFYEFVCSVKSQCCDTSRLIASSQQPVDLKVASLSRQSQAAGVTSHPKARRVPSACFQRLANPRPNLIAPLCSPAEVAERLRIRASSERWRSDSLFGGVSIKGYEVVQETS
eukprot:5982346-Prymnesium_polylepis.2